MFTRGIKRKCLDPEDELESSTTDYVHSYTIERQSLLDMSLVKLQLCHMLVEPNLCRSVLIANTVRQIQEEMTHDGCWQVFDGQRTEQPPLDHLVSTEILCRSTKEQDEENTYITYSEELDIQQTQEISDLTTVTSVKAVQTPQATLWELESSHDNQVHLQKSLDHIFETLDNRNTNSVEDLFSGVDTSYYDLDTVLTGVMGNAKLGHCEMLDGFPSQGAPPTNCKTEHNEIDHIVEILVES
ncbi:cell division cycle-associated protein 4 isoform X2 [Bombina bombina]|nr:cell division cycle-associated protein 4 isoform X2 [Bombina bombina]XP_053553223.1 cell division cycle-associated protein 4 isoform X2 [Bombina bombina]